MPRDPKSFYLDEASQSGLTRAAVFDAVTVVDPSASSGPYASDFLAGVSGISGFVFDKGGSVVNAMNPKYGLVGDGIADDTTAFLNASSDAQTRKVPLWIPAGFNIKLTANWPLWSGARIWAYGSYLDILSNHTGSGLAVTLTNLTDVEIHGLRLKSSTVTGRFGNWGMLNVSGGDQILLEDIWVTSGEGAGIWTGTPSQSTVAGVSRLRIVRPRIGPVKADGIMISRGAVDWWIVEPYIEGCGDDAIGINSVITDNSVNNYNQIARGHIIAPIIRNLTVVGASIGFYGAKDCTLVGGGCDTIIGHGVRFATNGGGNGLTTYVTSDVDVSDYHARACTGYGYDFSGGAADCTVTGGSAKGCTGDGAHIYQANNCTLTGVKLKDNTGYGVNEAGGSVGCKAKSCDLRGNAAGAYLFTAAGNYADTACDGVSAAYTQTGPRSPAATVSATAVMMGDADSITPLRTGKLRLTISGFLYSNTINDGVGVQMRYGTGTAPVNGAALTGTLAGSEVTVSNVAAANFTIPFSLQGIVTGLTLGTAYWVDIAVRAITGGSATVGAITTTAEEIA